MLVALRECCRIYTELPSVVTSVVGGDGTRCFRQLSIPNIITICPRLRDGMPVAYICPDDVQLIVSDTAHKPVRAQMQLDMSIGGYIALQYTLDDNCDQLALAKLRVCVRICGVLIIDVCVRAAAFNGQTAGHLCGQYTLDRKEYGSIAIRAVGTHLHLVISDPENDILNVYELPDMKLLATLGSSGNGPNNLSTPLGLCFTDANTLLIADFGNDRVQHWTTEGRHIATFATSIYPICVASRGEVVAVGTSSGVCVYSLESGAMLHTWPNMDQICTVAFAENATTLMVSNHTQMTVGLFTLDGRLLKHISAGNYYGDVVACADGGLLVAECSRSRIHVFAPNGTEITTAPFAAHRFQSHPVSFALWGERVYVLEDSSPMCISVFE